jgi:hypothetical protein
MEAATGLKARDIGKTIGKLDKTPLSRPAMTC